MLNGRAVTSDLLEEVSRAYFESMTVEQADSLHRMYGVEFEMNDGRLVGVRGINAGCCMGRRADEAGLLPAL